MATRRERVILELEDQFTTGMARAAASAALLNRELDSLSKDSIRTRRSISDIDRPIQDVGRSAGRSGSEIDKMSGRMRILADVTAILGPGLVGIGAVGVPAITGLASQLGFTVVAAGTAVLAFQGVGDALKTLNKAALEPTTQNLADAQVALEKLSPAAQEFVAHLGSLLPELRKLRDVAAEGLFPGLTQGLDAMETALPRVQGLISSVASELGSIAGDTGKSLASERWAPFLEFLAREAPQALGQMADAAGNTAHAVAELWMATDPINDDFGAWLVNATDDLDKWAAGLSKTQGFADFMAYLDKTGPKVADAFGAIANAALQIVQAAAPLSGPVLDGVKALADVVSAIANSDLGTPLFTAVAALALLNRTIAVTGSLQKGAFGGAGVTLLSGKIRGLTADIALLNVESARVGKGFIGPLTKVQSQATAASARLKTSLAGVGKSAALLGGLGIAATGAADSIGLTNTASLALMGTFIAPGWGTAIGGAAGALLDAKAAGDGFADSLDRARDAIKGVNVDDLAAAIAELNKQRKDLTDTSGVGDFFGDVSTKFTRRNAFSGNGPVDQIDNKLKQLQDKLNMTKAAASQDLLQHGFQVTAAGIDKATQSATKFQQSLQKANDILTGRSTARDFEQSLLDFEARGKKRQDLKGQIGDKQGDLASAQHDLLNAKTPSAQAAAKNRIDAAKESIKSLRAELALYAKTLDISTQAGIDNQATLDNIAATALKQAQGLKGTERVTFLAAAHDLYAKAAQDAGLAADAAQALADNVLGLRGVTGKLKIVIDADGAWHVIDLTKAKLDRLIRKTYKINIAAQASNIIPQVLDIHEERADGGTIYGQRWPYADKVLTPTAPGEEVITNRNGQADKWRPLLKRINAGLANGGTVPFSTATGAAMGASIDYERLAKAMSAVRPLAGEIKVYGDGSFAREHKRLSSLDGISR